MARIPRLAWLVALGAIAPTAAGAVTLPSSGSNAPAYSITDLGTLGGTGSQARALNARGQVVGDAARADGQSHAFVYGGNKPVDLAVTGSISVARGVNAAGQVTGFAYDGGYHAF